MKGQVSAEWPQAYDRLLLEAVDSTNAEALRRLPGLAGPVWILAGRQLAGRGRRGRAWTDPVGNFAATLALPTSEPPARLAQRSFLAALALAEALEGLTGLNNAFALKWPNDVLLEGGKLSGILLESAPSGLALGVGVNLRAAPSPEVGAAHPPVSLRAVTGFDIAPEALLAALAARYAEWETAFAARGFAPVRAAFLVRVARLGEPLVARTPSAEYRGRFETIDESGALVLATAEGQMVLPAADVFFT